MVRFQGKPDSPSNCTILNQTSETLHVECLEGFDGGLRQFFTMEVYDTTTRKLVSNVTSRFPVFLVGGLESGVGFEIKLYAVNRKGRSDSVHLQASTLKSAEKHTGVYGFQASMGFYMGFVALAPVLLNINPILGSLIGMVATLIFVAVAVVVVIRLRANEEHEKDLTSSPSTRCAGGNTDVELLDKDSEEKNPDIVPNKNVYVGSGDGVCTMKVVHNDPSDFF